MPDESQEWSRFLQEANIEYLDLIAPAYDFSKYQTPGTRGGTKKKRTAPRMVVTSNCQSLMMFKYVMELEDLVNASPRRVSPGPRERVSKRLIEPLREPVYTKHWLASQVGRDRLFMIMDGPTSS
jgi:hypothetical protein